MNGMQQFFQHARERLMEAKKRRPIEQMDVLRYLQGHMAELPELTALRAIDAASAKANDLFDPHHAEHHIDKALAAVNAYLDGRKAKSKKGGPRAKAP